MYLIYALIDPRTNDVRYVGCTDNIHRRFAQHLLSSHKNDEKTGWLEDLKEADVLPSLLVLEKGIEAENKLDRETFWINFYQQKGNLTNMRASKRLSRQTCYQEELTQVIDMTVCDERFAGKVQRALSDLSIIPSDGCVTTRDAARILNWRAKQEFGVECDYRQATIRKRAYNGTIKPARLMAGHRYWRIEDIFAMPIAPWRGNRRAA